MTVEATVGKTTAAMGAIVMVAAAIMFSLKLMSEVGAPWYIVFGMLFLLGAFIFGLGVYFRDTLA